MTEAEQLTEEDRLSGVFGVREEPAPVEDKQPEPVKEPEPKGEEPEKAEQDREENRPHQVPYAEFKKERDRRKTAEELREESSRRIEDLHKELQEQKRLLEQLRQPPQPQAQQVEEEEDFPDPVSDPLGYARAVQQRLETRMLSRELDMSERMAVKAHGKDLVDKAFDWAKEVGVLPRLIKSEDCYGMAVDLYQQATALREIGNPAQYRERLERELREKILDEMKQGQKQPPQHIPGTLADATATGTQGANETDEQMLDRMFASNRKR